MKRIQNTDIPRLQSRLSHLIGLFKGKERKEIEAKIEAAEKEVDGRIRNHGYGQDAGYPDGQTFTKAYNEAEKIVRKFNQELTEWNQQAGGKATA